MPQEIEHKYLVRLEGWKPTTAGVLYRQGSLVRQGTSGPRPDRRRGGLSDHQGPDARASLGWSLNMPFRCPMRRPCSICYANVR